MTPNTLDYISYPLQTSISNWYDLAWQFRKNITLNSSRIAENGLTNFPVLINISDPNLSTFAQADGDDILFTSSDGITKLDHEIENYTSGNLVAWVRIPSLANNTNTSIFMYYNNSAANNQQNRTGVWNASYLAVWHFREGAGTMANDSTRYNNNGTITGGARWNTTSQIDGAEDFDGADDYVNAGSGTSLDNLFEWTVTAWVRAESYGESNFGRIVVKSTSVSNFNWILFMDNTGAGNCANSIKFNVNFSTTGGGFCANNNTMRTGSWQHVALNYNRSGTENNATFYINGTNAGIQRKVKPVGTYQTDAAKSVIIGNELSQDRTFNGMMSELRIHNGTLSSGWIRTEYNNQYIPSAFHIISNQESQ